MRDMAQNNNPPRSQEVDTNLNTIPDSQMAVCTEKGAQRAVELLRKLRQQAGYNSYSGNPIAMEQLELLEKTLDSDLFKSVCQVYDQIYDTANISGSSELKASASAKATVAVFSASIGHSHPRTVELPKTNDSLGFNVMSYDGSPVFISRIVSGGVADQHGGLRRGDQLISINGINLEDADYVRAVELLKAAQGKSKVSSTKMLTAYQENGIFMLGDPTGTTATTELVTRADLNLQAETLSSGCKFCIVHKIGVFLVNIITFSFLGGLAYAYWDVIMSKLYGEQQLSNVPPDDQYLPEESAPTEEMMTANDVQTSQPQTIIDMPVIENAPAMIKQPTLPKYPGPPESKFKMSSRIGPGTRDGPTIDTHESTGSAYFKQMIAGKGHVMSISQYGGTGGGKKKKKNKDKKKHGHHKKHHHHDRGHKKDKKKH